jgi:hypothetical protein
VFAKTRAAAGWIIQHALSDIARARAAMLAGQLTRCEAALATGNGQAPTGAYGLLRAVVLTVRDLCGRVWLEASSDDPGVAAFLALLATARPPAIPELDQTAARVLWTRFAPFGHPAISRPPAAHRPDTTTMPGRWPPGAARPSAAYPEGGPTS